MPIPREFLQELEARSPIEEIVSSYVTLKRRGRNLVGLCPFHNEKTPSFNLYPENNSFYCFGCGKGGGVIQFVMDMENLAFPEAVEWLAQRAGLTVPQEGRSDDGLSRMRTRILEINRASARFFFAQLSRSEGRPGLDYLRARGLDNETITRFGLGFAPQGGFALTDHLKELGYSREELIASDMVRQSQRGGLYDRYRGRVMFPIIDLRGSVVAFGGRILTDEKPKYLNTAETLVYHKSSGLFAMNLARDSGSRELILAEGYMDVIALHRAGFPNAIASLGTSLTEEQARVIRRYADEAVICYDSDEAGQRATQRAIPILKKSGLLVRVITIPGEKDPDEFFRKEKDAPAKFRQLLESGGNDVEYRLGKLRAKYDLETSDGKSRYLRDALEVLAGLDPMERDIYAGKLSRETGVGKDSILTEAGRAVRQQSRRREKELRRSQREVAAIPGQQDRQRRENPRAAMAEDNVIAFLFRQPDKAGELSALLPPDKLPSAVGRGIYRLLLERIAEGGELTQDQLTQDLSEEERSRLSFILAGSRDTPPDFNDARQGAKVLWEEAEKITPESAKLTDSGGLQSMLDQLARQKGREPEE